MTTLVQTCEFAGVAETPFPNQPVQAPPGNSVKPRDRVKHSLSHLNVKFELDNDVALVYPVTEEVQQLIADFYGQYDESYRFQLAISMEEAITNAMIHGNLEISSESRISSDTLYYELIAKRTTELPYCVRRVFFSVALSRNQLILMVRDEGPGFEVAAVPDPTADENLDKPCGRGLMLMRNFMDTVVHNQCGNAVTMTKRPPNQT